MGAGSGGKGGPTPPQFGEAVRNGISQGMDRAATQIGNQGALPTGQEARDQAITAAYGQATSRLDPRFQQREDQLRTQLANQGLDPTSEAAQTELGNLGRERNDAYTSAMNGAIGQGTAAGSALFNQGVVGQMLPYQQLGALQGMQTQNYQNALQGASMEQAGKNSTLGGIGGTAAQIAPFFL